MKIYLESELECTVDGVGLLEPGKPVEVNPEYFRLFHGVRPAEANFPHWVKVIYDTDRAEAPKEAEVDEAKASETKEEEVN
jgi:hypothetical protein